MGSRLQCDQVITTVPATSNPATILSLHTILDNNHQLRLNLADVKEIAMSIHAGQSVIAHCTFRRGTFADFPRLPEGDVEFRLLSERD